MLGNLGLHNSSFCWALTVLSISWPFTLSVGLRREMNPSQSLYLNTEQHKHRINVHIHPCFVVGLEPTIPAFERAKKIHTLEGATTVIGHPYNRQCKYRFFNSHSGGWSPNWVHSARRQLLACCTCPGWLWGWRIWWNEDWQRTPKYSVKTCPSATLSTTNPTWLDPGANLDCRSRKPKTNRLSCGAAGQIWFTQFSFSYSLLKSNEKWVSFWYVRWLFSTV
jgi:hypothetical protein